MQRQAPDTENQVTQVVKDLVWKMGKNLLKGQFSDLMKIGTPAYIHSHQSYLHMISKDLSLTAAQKDDKSYQDISNETAQPPVHKIKGVRKSFLKKEAPKRLAVKGNDSNNSEREYNEY